ncbi:hypothetical protein C7N43_00565 [Sphingobacteriales bacterium UPWRP_1]|nr:hypothetical protein B6N25_10305 [Sphingobacteriales bacterium TSM_CSS]PSJ78969.1 hypothetical protein C7N43_00565 [Sphingobacteriales bacterium UPWRP_1]
MAGYSTDLFDLVKTLTVNEKAYFKKYAYKQQSDARENPYLRLFDAIDKQETYDEEKLVKKFAKEKFAQKFSAAKNYLYNLILDCLAMYDTNSEKLRHKLRQQIKQIEALIDRGLMEQAMKKVEATRKLLHPDNVINQYSWHIELINLQLEIMPYKTETHDERMKLQYEKSHLLSVIANSQEYYNLYLHSLHLLNQTGYTQLEKHGKQAETFQDIISHPLLADINLALSFNARLFYCNTWFNYYLWNADYHKALHFAQLQVAQFSTEALQLSNVQKLMVSYKGVLMALTKLEDYDQFDETVREIENWNLRFADKVTPEAVNTLMDAVYGSPFDAYYNQKRYAKAFNLIPNMRQYLENRFAQRFKGNNIHYTLLIAALNFYAGNLNQALTELEVVLNDKDLETVPITHCTARILHLLIHFELKNDLLLESLGRATYRFLYQYESNYQVESLIIRFMRNASQIANAKEMTEALKKLREKLEPFLSDEFEREAFARLHYLDWIDSKLNNCTVWEWTEKQHTKRIVAQKTALKI